MNNETFIIGAQHRYSTIDPFNCNRSRMILQHPNGLCTLHTNKGTLIGNLPTVSSSTEYFWHRTDPKLFYYLVHNVLYLFNTTEGKGKPLYTFSEYIPLSPGERNGVTLHGEQDLSDNGQFLVMAGDLGGQVVEVFRFDVEALRKGTTLQIQRDTFDQLYITPSNNILIGWYKAGTARFSGVELYDGQSFRFLRQVHTRSSPHMDVCRDAQGYECIVTDIEEGGFYGPALIRLSDARRTPLFAHPYAVATQFTAPQDQPWCVVSTYNPSDPRSTALLANNLVRVDFTTPPTITDLGRHGTSSSDSETQPMASISHDGKQLVWRREHDCVIADMPSTTLPPQPSELEWTIRAGVVNGELIIRSITPLGKET